MAAAAGLGLVFAEPFEYRSVANLRIVGATAQHLESYRAEFLNHVWELEGSESGRAARETWSAEFPSPSELKLICRGTARSEDAIARITDVAEAYAAKIRAIREEARKTPTEAELALSTHASELQARLSQLEPLRDAARESASPADPQVRRAVLLERWESLRRDFASSRQELQQATAEIARLEAEPDPTHGIVPTEERRGALEADVMLQQDLSELVVRLSEVKLHLLSVWRESAGKLEQLVLAVDGLVGDEVREDRLKSAGDLRRMVERLLTEGGQYRDLLAAFAASWSKEFTAVRRMEVDPLSSGLLDSHERARKLLNDFLFHSGKLLAAMRTSIQAISDQSSVHARYYVLQSDLVRAFQAIQTAHHRFEFAGGSLETSDNFRLDSALRGARGLHRRSQLRIRLIDERLQAKAVRLARQRRMRELAESQRRFAGIREQIDRTIENLITLQEELNLNAERRETFLREARERQTLDTRIESTQRDLIDIRDRVRELVAGRTTAREEGELELVSVETHPRPVNLLARCRTGGIGALIALVALSLVQWRVTRRVR